MGFNEGDKRCYDTMGFWAGIKSFLLAFVFNSKIRFVGLTFVFVIILLSGAIIDSVEQKSITPLVEQVGEQIFASDYAIEQKMTTFAEVESPSTWKSITTFFSILANVYIIYIFWLLIYKVIRLINDSEKLLFMVISAFALFCITTAYVSVTVGYFRWGFTGLLIFVSNITIFFNPVREGTLRFAKKILPQVPNMTKQAVNNVTAINFTKLV